MHKTKISNILNRPRIKFDNETQMACYLWFSPPSMNLLMVSNLHFLNLLSLHHHVSFRPLPFPSPISYPLSAVSLVWSICFTRYLHTVRSSSFLICLNSLDLPPLHLCYNPLLCPKWFVHSQIDAYC